jgi:hypothetical protein
MYGKKQEETASPKVPTPSPVIRANPPEPVPEYPHSPPKATSKVTYRDDGPHDFHDELGRLQVRTFYKNNEALRFERYYENGSLYQKGSLKNGELHGPFERFDETGRAVEKGHMSMAKRCGKWWWRSKASDEWVLMKTHRPCVGPSAERYKD